jgi:MFS family permease
MLAVVAGLASASSMALAAFFVGSLTDGGVDASGAGALLALGSLVGAATRVGAGWLQDRRGTGVLGDIAVLLGAGAIGVLVLGMTSLPALLLPAVMLAFGGAWGWPGLAFLAVARMTGQQASAIGPVQAGSFAGCVLGPLGFGLIVDQVSYTTAWLTAAVLLLIAAAFALVERQSRPL